MTRRFASLWLPTWATDRWRRHHRAIRGVAAPLVLTARQSGGLSLVAVDAAAAAEGLRPGLTLADARALVPNLVAAEADPAADAAALGRLADWAMRYAPLVATDGPDGLVLDITGCAHLFGGEAALLEDATARLARFGIHARGSIADTPAAAWAWARFRGRDKTPILSAGHGGAPLAELPVAALRLPPASVAALARVGLRTIGDLLRLPRAPLAARYGGEVVRRLDRLLGTEPEPIAPRRPPASWRCRLAFAEPIGRREGIEAATGRLLGELCARLEAAGRGARRLTLTLVRVDGTQQRIEIGAGRASRDPAHLLRLFREDFDGVDSGFGIEVMTLEATATERLDPGQIAFCGETGGKQAVGPNVAELVDRLAARAGRDAVLELVPRDSHLPERAGALRPAVLEGAGPGWGADPDRPVMLLANPEPIEADAVLPGAPPATFRWRGRIHRVGLLEGPERIRPEWWRGPVQGSPTGGLRDYYRIETLEGRRFWLFRTPAERGAAGWRWFLHGLFA